jgi:DNA (cytosine-5)-methyltransferase 1
MIRTGAELRQIRVGCGISQARLSELSGVEQYRISAFELEKTSLDAPSIERIAEIIQNSNSYSECINRKKRYRNHSYGLNKYESARAVRAKKTDGNVSYLRDLEMLSRGDDSTINAISLFSGIGGFSLGFQSAGYNLKGFVELDDALAEIYRANFPGSKRLGDDVASVDVHVLKKFCDQVGPIDIIIGGPPCQGFSLSGKRDLNDPRNYLFQEYMKVIDIVRPKAVVVENVKLLTSMKSKNGGMVKDQILFDLREHGYKAKIFEVDAADYGVPQNRHRVFFIGVRGDLGVDPSFPNKEYGSGSDLFKNLKPQRTFADACSDLAYLESGESSDDPMHVAVKHPDHVIEWLWDVPEGTSAHDNEDPTLRPPSGYNTTYKRQVWLEPAATVQTTFGMISGCRNVHPIATRSLTVREAARLQSFPDTFEYCGSMGTIRTGIGNAVPPMLARKIALHLRSELFTRNST